jgi:hypothetical protein
MLGGSARSSQVRDLEIAVSVEMRAADAVFCNERWRQVEGWPTICEGADCNNPILCMCRVAICLHSAVCFLIQTLPKCSARYWNCCGRIECKHDTLPSVNGWLQCYTCKSTAVYSYRRRTASEKWRLYGWKQFRPVVPTHEGQQAIRESPSPTSRTPFSTMNRTFSYSSTALPSCFLVLSSEKKVWWPRRFCFWYRVCTKLSVAILGLLERCRRTMSSRSTSNQTGCLPSWLSSRSEACTADPGNAPTISGFTWKYTLRSTVEHLHQSVSNKHLAPNKKSRSINPLSEWQSHY